jgi:hypothetical protein
MEENEDKELEKFLPQWYLEMRKVAKTSKNKTSSH